MDRVNSQGIPRQRLIWTLAQVKIVKKAIKEDSCLLCRAKGVNDAALCEVCYALLDEAEFKAADCWLSGVGP